VSTGEQGEQGVSREWAGVSESKSHPETRVPTSQAYDKAQICYKLKNFFYTL
jgi:hypothetical protein